MTPTSITKQYRNTFSSIISIFQELVNTEAGHVTAFRDPAAPSISDLICDVDLAARRSLTASELSFFKHFYRTAQIVVSEGDNPEQDLSQYRPYSTLFKVITTIDSRVREKLGKALHDAGICPLSSYFTPTTRVAAS